MAFRRAVSHANGWYGWALSVDGTKKCLAGLRKAAETGERPQELGALEIVSPPPDASISIRSNGTRSSASSG